MPARYKNKVDTFFSIIHAETLMLPLGSVEDHRIRAEVLEEQENQFAEKFLDARDEAANVRTVTDENILDTAATRGIWLWVHSLLVDIVQAMLST